MGEPPRLPKIQLPWEKSIIYFVTLCVKDRRKVLANPKMFQAIKATVAQLCRWHLLAAVIMPDHAHLIVSPIENRGLSVGDFSTGLKRVLRKTLGSQAWEWQRGCFDRLLRSDENLHSKWIYVQDNPVRHGLVEKGEDWPYYLDYINEAHGGSCQLPLQATEQQTIRVGGR